MAVTVSGTSPLSHALQSLGVQRPAPEQKPDPKSAFESLSRETNVPANVLIALDEADGGAGDLDKARRHAAFLGEKLAAGAKIEDAVAGEDVSVHARTPTGSLVQSTAPRRVATATAD